MVITGLFNMGDVPFRHVYIHPMIQDGYGERMSKQRATASTRSTSSTLRRRRPAVHPGPRWRPRRRTCGCRSRRRRCPTAAQVNTSERFEQGRTFPNKFWNAARFALMNLEGYEPEPVDPAALPVEDRWILSLLARTTAAVTADLEGFHFAEATRRLRDFTWNDFCDWYVEFLKGRLRDPDDPSGRPARPGGGPRRPLPPAPSDHAVRDRAGLAGAGRGRPRPRPAGRPSPPPRASASPPGRSSPRPWHDPEAEAVVAQLAGDDRGPAQPPRRAERAGRRQDRADPRRPSGPAAEALRQGEPFLKGLTDAASVTIVPAAERPPNSAVVVSGRRRDHPAAGRPDRPRGGGGPAPQGPGRHRQAARGRSGRSWATRRSWRGPPPRSSPQQRAKEAELVAQRAAVAALLAEGLSAPAVDPAFGSR